MKNMKKIIIKMLLTLIIKKLITLLISILIITIKINWMKQRKMN